MALATALFASLAATLPAKADLPVVTLTRLHSFGDSRTYAPNPQGHLIEGSDGVLYGTTPRGGVGYGTVFRVNRDGTGLAVLKIFSAASDGSVPLGVIEGRDGALYGAALQGAAFGSGAVFRLNKDGSNFAVLKNFDSSTDRGGPQERVIEGSDGILYGALWGATGTTVYRMNKDGTGFAVLTTGFAYAGRRPDISDSLTEGTDGVIYGTTQYRGDFGAGTVFRMNKDGSGFATLKSFDDSWSEGSSPRAAMIEGSDGALYGTTYQGGVSGYGTVFRINKDGTGFSVLRSLDYFADGAFPRAGVTEGSDGALYGTATEGGDLNCGTVFRMNKDGSGFAVLRSFISSSDGVGLQGALTEGSDGALYGAASSGGITGLGTVFRINKDGSGFAAVLTLNGRPDGAMPWAITEGSDGALHGTTSEGGKFNLGAVFRTTKDGANFTVLKSFKGSDGARPYADGVTEATDGALYGTTSEGGDFGYGTMFRINKDGAGFAVLKSPNGGTEGAFPSSGLTEGSDGALYGTTSQGGDFGYGTVFRMNKDGTGFTVLKSLNGGSDGQYPSGGVTEGSDGAMYVTASGANIQGFGCTLFRINKDGSGFIVLRNFVPAADGAFPSSGVIEGSDGTLYGTTVQYGPAGGGTVFRVGKDGSGFAVLKSFAQETDGGILLARVIEGPDGALYGAAYNGGALGGGTLFRLKKDGTHFQVLKALGGTAGPPQKLRSKLLVDAMGRFFGTSEGGGDLMLGTVFALQIGQPSPPRSLASINPTSAVANGTGFTLTVNGANLDASARVYWNGSARPTTYASPSQVTAQIPASDLANVMDIQTVNVTVGGLAGPESTAAIFAIVPASVGEVQTV